MMLFRQMGVAVLPTLLMVFLSANEMLGEEVSRLVVAPNVETARMGGVDVPEVGVLREMHQSRYILHAAQGALSRLPVSRVRLPHSDGMNPQAVQVDVGPGGEIYVRQTEVFCKSTDGGQTWTARPITLPPGLKLDSGGRYCVTGRLFLSVVRSEVSWTRRQWCGRPGMTE